MYIAKAQLLIKQNTLNDPRDNCDLLTLYSAFNDPVIQNYKNGKFTCMYNCNATANLHKTL